MSNPYEDMRKMTVGQIAQGTGLQAALFCAIGLGLWYLADRPLAEFVTFAPREFAIGLGLALVLIAIGHILFTYFPNFSERLVRMQARNFGFLEKRLAMPMIIWISICAGVGEEALFRGGMMILMSEYTPFWIALVGSSLVFTIIHFAKPLIAAIIFIIGAYFGLAYWWTGSLLAVMIGHAVYDVYALWYLQKEMHRLQVFEPLEDDTEEPEAAPPPAA